jgi:DNA-binding transcriptional ArsR family regulator
MAYERVLTALADPTRRGLFERLSRRPHPVGELARLARVSQPTVSQHLRVLREAHLVTHERAGTSRLYRASRAGVDELRRYLESMWDDVLAAYAAGDSAPPRQKRGKR